MIGRFRRYIDLIASKWCNKLQATLSVFDPQDVPDIAYYNIFKQLPFIKIFIFICSTCTIVEVVYIATRK